MFRLFALLITTLCTAACQHAKPLPGPVIPEAAPGAFLAGHWSTMPEADHGSQYSEETWLPFVEDGSVGVNRTMVGDRTVFYEFLRIERSDSETMYIAHPKGRSPGTRFTLIEHGDNHVVFENPDHDFPQRIIYERDGNTLQARIEGTQNGQQRTESWTYHRSN